MPPRMPDATVWIEIATSTVPAIIKLLKTKDKQILDLLEDTEVTALRIKAKARAAKRT
jgi:hypothetical protein